MGYLSNIKKQYMISFFQSLIPAYVIERLFWAQRGMTVQMVVYAEIIYALTVIIFELPSGILADKFGRKRLIVICNAFAAIEFIMLLFAYNFWHFALAVFLSGVGRAFSSGSEHALIYDSLLAETKQNDFEKIMGRILALEFGGHVIAALSGSLLADLFSFELNYIISIGSMAIAFCITLGLREPPMVTNPESELINARQYAGQALEVFKKQPLVLLYCLTGAVLGAGLIYLDEFWQIILSDIGTPVLFFGAVSAAVLLARVPGNLIAYKIKEKISFRRILGSIIIAQAGCYIALFFTQSLLCLIPMAIASILAGLIEPLTAGYLHHHTESHIRATVESFSSLGLRAASIMIGLAFGFVSTNISIFAGFGLLGALILIYYVCFAAWHNRITKTQKSKEARE